VLLFSVRPLIVEPKRCFAGRIACDQRHTSALLPHVGPVPTALFGQALSAQPPRRLQFSPRATLPNTCGPELKACPASGTRSSPRQRSGGQ
jgi:hypothetical protein